MITVKSNGQILSECTSIIIVPQKGLEEAGYIQTLTVNRKGFSKHEFHALAQTAYFQFQDDELPVSIVKGSLDVEADEFHEQFASAMIVYRNGQGSFGIFINDNLSTKKMLEAAHRYCSRWVRLDI